MPRTSAPRSGAVAVAAALGLVSLLSAASAGAVPAGAGVDRPGHVAARDSAALAAPALRVSGERVTMSARINAVDAGAADDVWAVGYRGRREYRALAQHWDGQRWTRVKTPSPGGHGEYLIDVAVVAPDDVWAVGTYYPNLAWRDNLVKHWDGTSWSIVDVPQPDGTYAVLTHVSAIAPDHVIASGRVCSGEQCVLQTMRWDGATWSLVDQRPESLVQMTDSISAIDAWGVGNSGYSGGEPAAHRWDGRRWRPSALPDPQGPDEVTLVGVTVADESTAWIVGRSRSDTGAPPYVLRWSGSEWQHEQLGARHPVDRVAAVSASAVDDAWIASAELGEPWTGEEPALHHWDGRRWSFVPNPARHLLHSAELADVVAVGPDDAWAVGSVSAPSNDRLPLAMRWNGTRWQVTDNP